MTFIMTFTMALIMSFVMTIREHVSMRGNNWFRHRAPASLGWSFGAAAAAPVAELGCGTKDGCGLTTAWRCLVKYIEL